jgi:hypothetical protein
MEKNSKIQLSKEKIAHDLEKLSQQLSKPADTLVKKLQNTNNLSALLELDKPKKPRRNNSNDFDQKNTFQVFAKNFINENIQKASSKNLLPPIVSAQINNPKKYETHLEKVKRRDEEFM